LYIFQFPANISRLGMSAPYGSVSFSLSPLPPGEGTGVRVYFMIYLMRSTTLLE
jgi:hypothetical protein